MDSALIIHRLQFAFTVTYHYLFPQLTMGLALLIVVLKTIALRKNDEAYDRAARFWAKIFGINFVMGVITGIPMEFQFGTNWSHFSRFAGGVIGQTLAMEGLFAFFLESTFLGLFLYGEKRLSKTMHWFCAFMVFFGSWLSGYFIVATDAWMQNPVGYAKAADGTMQLTSFWQLLLNPWALVQYAHNMCGAAVTGAFVMTAIGAFYLLARKHTEQARIYIRTGVIAGLIFSVVQLFPTGDHAGKMVAQKQPVTLAAMEMLFNTQEGAPLVIIGQPNMVTQTIDNGIHIPRMLSFLTYRRWNAEVKGLNDVPQNDWPQNIPLLYYSYHIMVGLGTMFIAITVVAAFLLWRGALYNARWMLWILLLAAPFPYIANTAGWMTAELGRQPWLVYGLMRTADGYSKMVSAGNGWFTFLGFAGMYTVLSILFIFLITREIEHGPEPSVLEKAKSDQHEFRGGAIAMATLWFMIVAVMVAAYVLLDGFDLGAGAVHLCIAKTNDERRTILRAIGPVWDGNEVWLLAAGGALYFAFPLLYASSFSGFYLPLMMVLWLLMLRAIGIEFRAHIDEPMWQGFFDVVFNVSSMLLAIFFGAALGNVVRGVPLNADGYFFEPLWTNWLVGKQNGILDWYTVLCGVVALVTLTIHGCLYLAMKTEGDLNQRARKVASTLWLVQVLLTGLSLIATLHVQPVVLNNYYKWPIGFVIPVVVVASLVYMFVAMKKKNDLGAFLASCGYIVGMLVGAAFALYPMVLPSSTDPAYSLTIENTKTGAHGMAVGFVWWSIGMVFAIAYFVFLFRMFRGKVNLEEGGEHGY